MAGTQNENGKKLANPITKKQNRRVPLWQRCKTMTPISALVFVHYRRQDERTVIFYRISAKIDNILAFKAPMMYRCVEGFFAMRKQNETAFDPT